MLRGESHVEQKCPQETPRRTTSFYLQKAPLIIFRKSKRNYETTHPPSRQFVLDFITKIVSPSPAQIAGLDAGLRSKI
eukprot:scaffold129894_cov53-Attheya_sp.AAC.2